MPLWKRCPQVMAQLRRFLDSHPSEPDRSEGPSAVPISAQSLREDWADDPNLSSEQARALNELDDETLDTHLAAAFAGQSDAWFQVLDRTRFSATETLLEQIEAGNGTQR